MLPSIAQWQSRGKTININGHDVFVIDKGEHEETLLILHGFPTCSYDYYKVLDTFTKHFRVIVHDHVGFGLSGRPLDYSYTLVDQADIAMQVWQHLGVTKGHILAHDYGTSVATEIVFRCNVGSCPIGIQSVTLGNGSMLIEIAGLLPIQRILKNPTLGPMMARVINQKIFDRNMRKIWHDKSTLPQEELDILYQLIWSHPDTRKVFQKIAAYVDQRFQLWHRWITHGLYKTELPIHLVWADQDRIAIIEMAHRLHANIKDSSLTILEDIGHYPMLEAPEKYAEAVLANLS